MTALENLEQNYSLSVYEGWDYLARTARRSRPDDLTMEQVSSLGRRARLVYEEQRSVWHANIGPIMTPEMVQVTTALDEIIQTNRQDGDKVRSSAVLDAYPGLGKTTLATAYGRQFHLDQLELYGPTTSAGHARVPVAYVRLTSNTTMRSLNSMLCRFYGHPGAERGTATQLAIRAATCAAETQTRLIITDDIHFLDMRRRDGRDVVNHFKWLANEFSATFLFVGVGIASRGLMNEGLGLADEDLAQTARRWTRFTLGPFHVNDDGGRRVWRKLLLSIEKEVVLAKKHPGMITNELGDYLYARSTGHFASLMTLVVRGCHKAIKQGEERLTKELLDTVRNDEASEQARRELEARFRHGTMTSVPTR